MIGDGSLFIRQEDVRKLHPNRLEDWRKWLGVLSFNGAILLVKYGGWEIMGDLIFCEMGF